MRGWAFLLLCLLLPLAAHAEAPRVVLVKSDPELRDAIHVALAPWKTSVVEVDTEPPSGPMADAVEQARDLADRQRASAVVWVNADGPGTLFVYDRQEHWIIARPLGTEIPFDAPSAAAAALSVKTALRHSEVAPPQERRPRALREPRSFPRFVTSLAGGLRVRQTDARRYEARASLGATYFPSALDGRLGAGVLLGTGPGISVTTDSFAGRFLEHVLLATLVSRVPFGRHVDLRTFLGAGFQITSLSGSALDPAIRSSALRANPALSAHLELGYALDALRFALRAGGVIGLRTQTYLMDGTNILKVERFAPEVSLVVEIAIP